MRDHARPGGTALRAIAALVALSALLPATAVAVEPLPAVPAAPGSPQLGAPPLPDAPVIGPLPASAPVAPEVRSPVTPPPVATASGGCPGESDPASAWSRSEAVRCLVNRARHQIGLPGFRRNGSLARAATLHARDMARGRYFGHQRAGGPPLERRARRAGWRGRRLGEAIAYGCYESASPLSVVSSWLASPPHAGILLSGSLQRVGVGSAPPPLDCQGATYVLVAGRG
jgi:uncharacterized protein YkwD